MRPILDYSPLLKGVAWAAGQRDRALAGLGQLQERKKAEQATKDELDREERNKAAALRFKALQDYENDQRTAGRAREAHAEAMARTEENRRSIEGVAEENRKQREAEATERAGYNRATLAEKIQARIIDDERKKAAADYQRYQDSVKNIADDETRKRLDNEYRARQVAAGVEVDEAGMPTGRFSPAKQAEIDLKARQGAVDLSKTEAQIPGIQADTEKTKEETWKTRAQTDKILQVSIPAMPTMITGTKADRTPVVLNLDDHKEIRDVWVSLPDKVRSGEIKSRSQAMTWAETNLKPALMADTKLDEDSRMLLYLAFIEAIKKLPEGEPATR